MSVQYNGKHSIDIWITNSESKTPKNTWVDYRLIPAEKPVINVPEPITSLENLPGSNQRLYFTGLLKEGRTYQMREGEIEFYMVPIPSEISDIESRIATIIGNNGMWMWDTFNFEEGNLNDIASNGIVKNSITPDIKYMITVPSIVYGITDKMDNAITYKFIILDNDKNSELAKAIKNEFGLVNERIVERNSGMVYYIYEKIVNVKKSDAHILYRKLLSELNGSSVNIRLSDDHSLVYKGRLSFNPISQSDKYSTISISYRLYPELSQDRLYFLVKWYNYDGTFIYEEICEQGYPPTIYSEPNNPVGQPSDYHNAPEDGSAPDDPVKCNRHHIKKGGNITLAYRDARDPESNTYIHTEHYICDTGYSYNFKINWLYLTDDKTEILWYPLALETSEENYIYVSGILQSPDEIIIVDMMPAFIVDIKNKTLELFNVESYSFGTNADSQTIFTIA